MAKVKTYAVEVTVTHTVTVLVDARRPGGAIERLRTDEGWREATRYQEDLPFPYSPRGVEFGTPREM